MTSTLANKKSGETTATLHNQQEETETKTWLEVLSRASTATQTPLTPELVTQYSTDPNAIVRLALRNNPNLPDYARSYFVLLGLEVFHKDRNTAIEDWGYHEAKQFIRSKGIRTKFSREDLTYISVVSDETILVGIPNDIYESQHISVQPLVNLIGPILQDPFEVWIVEG